MAGGQDITGGREFELPVLEAPVELSAPEVEEPAEPEQPETPPIDLEAEREAAREAGHREGYEAGFGVGLQEGRALLKEAVDALRAAADAVAAERERVSAAVEEAAVDLALQIAEHVIGGELVARPEHVLDAVRGALRRLVERERVTILVNPDDLDLVREHAPAIVDELGGVEHFEVQAERRVGRGGAVVRTVEGEVDATIATKLARVREVLGDEHA
jgi:flagellar assembly protein FliH